MKKTEIVISTTLTQEIMSRSGDFTIKEKIQKKQEKKLIYTFK